jgi:hypothetical protein
MGTTLFLRRGVSVDGTTACHRGWSQTKLSVVSSSGMEGNNALGGQKPEKKSPVINQGQSVPRLVIIGAIQGHSCMIERGRLAQPSSGFKLQQGEGVVMSAEQRHQSVHGWTASRRSKQGTLLSCWAECIQLCSCQASKYEKRRSSRWRERKSPSGKRGLVHCVELSGSSPLQLS